MKCKIMYGVIGGTIIGVIGLVFGLLVGMHIGGNYYTAFEFAGVRGYEAVGKLGAMLGAASGALFGAVLGIKIRELIR